MLMKRKKKKYYREIGEQEYKFDYKKEKNIYMYYCLNKLSKKEEKEIRKLQDEKEIFGNKYCDWKKYIYKKYEKYSIEALENFAHYIQQGTRNNKVIRVYNTMTLPVIITLVLTIMFEKVIEDILINNIENKSLATEVVVIGIFICVLSYIAWIVITTIFDDSVEKNMYSDYLRIIKEMIKKKKCEL